MIRVNLDDILTGPPPPVFEADPKPAPLVVPDLKPDRVPYHPSVCRIARQILWNEGGSLDTLCAYLKVDRKVLSEWKRKYVEFKEALQEGIDLGVHEIERNFRKTALPHDEVTEEEITPTGASRTTKRNVVSTQAALAILRAHVPEYRMAKTGSGPITGKTVEVNLRLFTQHPERYPNSKQIEATVVASSRLEEEPESDAD